MKECDKRKSHKSSKLRVIYISSNNVRHPVTKILDTLLLIQHSEPKIRGRKLRSVNWQRALKQKKRVKQMGVKQGQLCTK
jgi:hypothetical protein